MASPRESQRNSNAPFNSRCSAVATSSSKLSCEGTAVTVIAISMTSLDLVMNLRSSSPEGGAPPEKWSMAVAALVASLRRVHGIDFAPGSIPGLVQVQGAAASSPVAEHS